MPEGLVQDRFRLRLLTVNDVVKDFEAINARVRPDGTRDPWNNVSLEQNLVDLGWHQKECQLRRSFAYTVVAPDDSKVLGCVYLDASDEADAEVRLWVRREAWEQGLDAELEGAVRRWLAGAWPFDRIDWGERA